MFLEVIAGAAGCIGDHHDPKATALGDGRGTVGGAADSMFGIDLPERNFTRVRIDGDYYPIEEAPALDKKYKHDIEVVVDRIVVRDGIQTRLADSFRTALDLADGIAIIPTDIAEISLANSSSADRQQLSSPLLPAKVDKREVLAAIDLIGSFSLATPSGPLAIAIGVETKSARGRASSDQLAWHCAMQHAGWRTCFASDLATAETFLVSLRAISL